MRNLPFRKISLLLLCFFVCIDVSIGQTPPANLTISPSTFLTFPTTMVGDTSAPISLTIGGSGFFPNELIIIYFFTNGNTGNYDFNVYDTQEAMYMFVARLKPDASGLLADTIIDLYFMPDQIGTLSCSIQASATASVLSVGSPVISGTAIASVSTFVDSPLVFSTANNCTYPNPCLEGTIYFEQNSRDPIQSIMITNSSGEMKQIYTGFQHSIDVTDFEKGIYFVHMKNDQGIRTEKIVVF